MSGFPQILPIALRAGAWHTTPNAPRVRLPVLILWAALAISIEVLLEFFDAGPNWRFHPAGLNYAIAANAIMLVIAALFVAPRARMTALSALLGVGMIYAIFSQGLSMLFKWAGIVTTDVPVWSPVSIGMLVFFVTFIWWTGALVCVVRSAETPQPAPRLALRVIAMAILLIAVTIASPQDYAFRGRNFDVAQSNWWEVIRTSWNASRDDDMSRLPRMDSLSDRAELRQPALLEKAFTSLAPQREGKIDVFALGIAGWSTQDVFPKERDGALAALPQAYEIADRTIRLTNHTSSLFTQPLANRQNIAAALSAIGRAMNKEEDVLLIFMTSHGAENGFALYLPGSVEATLTPSQLASALDAEGIKNRVIIVSSCYSGAFIERLANDDTVVITASDAKSTSFGCANDRDWTYFGQALFDIGMLRHSNLQSAFEDARSQILQWEARDKIPASNPQAHFGATVMAKLRTLTGDSRSAEIPVPVARP
jgi:hypothetical protein